MTLDDLLEISVIHTITVPECKYSFHRGQIAKDGNLYYKFNVDDGKIIHTQNGDRIDVFIPYYFAATREKDEDIKNESIFFKLEVTYNVELVLDKDLKVDKKAMKAFIKNILPRVLHPYFRHTVSEALQKAGLPQLNLPLFESLSLDGDED